MRFPSEWKNNPNVPKHQPDMENMNVFDVLND
jgi:hypothetical protein